MMGEVETGGWWRAATVALVIMAAPATVGALVLFGVLAVMAVWLGWASLSRDARAEDDRAEELVSSVPVLPRASRREVRVRMPRYEVMSRPDPVVSPPARMVPGTVQGWMRREVRRRED